jgi:hypothetical protein
MKISEKIKKQNIKEEIYYKYAYGKFIKVGIIKTENNNGRSFFK